MCLVNIHMQAHPQYCASSWLTVCNSVVSHFGQNIYSPLEKKKRVKDSLLIKTDILLLAIMLYGVLFCQYVQALIKPTDVSVIGAAIRTCLSLAFLPILTVAISFVLKVS